MIPSLPIFADNFLLESGVQGENMTCLLKQDAWTFPFSQVTNLTLSLSPKSQISRTHNDDRIKSTFQQSIEISTHHYEIKSTHCNIVLPSKKFKILFIFLFSKWKVTQGFLLRSESTQKRGSRDGHACLRLEKTMIRGRGKSSLLKDYLDQIKAVNCYFF